MNSRIDSAVACFKCGFNCSQSIFSTYSTGLDRDAALKISTGFGAGMSRTGQTCGAVTGAYMAIGLKHGKCLEGDEQAKERTYALTREFAQRFIARNGSVNCSELLGCDLGTPEGQKMMKERGLIETHCTKYVRDAAEILEELL